MRNVTKAGLWAVGAQPVAEPNSDDLEDQELLLLSRAEIERALREGAFKVLIWPAAVGMALTYMNGAAT